MSRRALGTIKPGVHLGVGGCHRAVSGTGVRREPRRRGWGVAFGYLWKPTAVRMAHPSPAGDAFSHLEVILGIAFKVS